MSYQNSATTPIADVPNGPGMTEPLTIFMPTEMHEVPPLDMMGMPEVTEIWQTRARNDLMATGMSRLQATAHVVRMKREPTPMPHIFSAVEQANKRAESKGEDPDRAAIWRLAKRLTLEIVNRCREQKGHAALPDPRQRPGSVSTYQWHQP